MKALWFLSVSGCLLLGLMGCASGPRPANLSEEETARLREQEGDALAQRLRERAERAKRGGKEAADLVAGAYFLRGNAAWMEGDYATAVAFLKPLAELTDDAFVHRKLAVGMIRLGQLDESRAVLEKLHARDPKNEDVALILAGVQGAQGKGAEAQAGYRRILAHNPRQQEACLFLGKALAQDKKWKEAEARFKACQKLHPEEGAFSYYLGKMHVDREDLPRALAAFEEAHRRDPASTQAATALGVVYEQQERPADAVAVYRRHLEHKPEDALVLNRLVQAMFLMERFKEAIPYAERLVDLEPDNLNMRVKLGVLYTDIQDYSRAVSVFRELLQLAPKSDKILYYLGAIHQELRQYESAIDYFDRIPEDSGLYQDSSFQVANMLATLAQAEDSWRGRFLETLAVKESRIPGLKVELAVLRAGYHESRGEDDLAVGSLERVRGAEGFGPQHSYYLANLLEKLKRYEDSTALVMAILDKDPQNAHAWNFLGYSMLERGTPPDEALPFIQKALRLSPDDGYIRDSLGWYYHKKGQHQRALKELNAAFAKVPGDVAIAKHLAIVHQGLRDFRKARGFLEHALKHAKAESERKDVQAALENLERRQRVPAAID